MKKKRNEELEDLIKELPEYLKNEIEKETPEKKEKFAEKEKSGDKEKNEETGSLTDELEWFEEQTKFAAIKLERAITLMEILERAIEEEFDIDNRKMTCLSYIISDYLDEAKNGIEMLESKVLRLSCNV